MTILVQYNIICTGCGVMQGDEWKDGGMKALQAAVDDGWYRGQGDEHLCPECGETELGASLLSTVVLREPTGPPPGYSAPVLVCSCGTKTGRQEGRCRGCGKELKLPQM